MEYATQLLGLFQSAFSDVVSWKQSTQMCSRDAHEFMYALVFGWFVLLIFSIWLYRKINPSKSKKNVGASPKNSQQCLESPINSL